MSDNTVGVLNVEVTADTSGMKKKISRDAEAAGTSAGASLGKKMGMGIAAGAAVVGAGAVAATAAVVNLGRSYEDNMLQVQAVTGATAQQMEMASKAAKDLGNDVTLPGVSAAGAADAMLQLAKAGFSVEEAAKAADGAMRLAVASNMEVGQAAEITANAVGAFGLEAQEATRVSDLLAKGSTSAATTVAELGTGMAQSSAMFAAAGLPVEELVTQLALMANAGVKGSDAGTSLKTMLQKLQAPTKQAAGAMKDMGINVFDAQGNLRPMRNLVEEFSKATADMSEEQKAAAINTIFGADASRAANIVLTQGVEKYDELASAMGNATGSAADLAAATSKGLSGAIEAIQSSLETIAIDIYEQIAPSLTEVFKTIQPLVDTLAPVLGELGVAFSKIATTIGTALTGAVANLIPAVTPLLTTIANLAQRMAPLLTKVLEKVAEVIGKVLEAVVPLLEPLMELVFGILEAAWPIIEIVVDTFMILVDALKPLLDAVMVLLQPLTQLIQVALAALMPILKPILPLIELLATILGAVLVRAIGLLMTSIGYMITAWAKAGAFILDKFIDPVMDAFFTFVGNLVKGAAEAFGWVPGLGGQLQSAANSFDSWATDTKKSIKGAATTAVQEADKIAGSLVESGKEMMMSGEAQSTMYGAGKQLASYAADGIVDGVYFSSSSLYAAGQNLAKPVVSGAKNTLESNSPSKVFIRLGGDVVDGFEIGLKNMDKIPDKVREPLEKAIKVSEDRINELIKTTREQLDDAIQVWDDYRAGVLASVTGNVNFVTAMQQTQEQEKAVIAAQEKLNEARAAATNNKDDDGSGIANAEKELAAAQAAVKSYEDNLNAMLDQSEFFGTMFSKASDAMLEQFGAESPIWHMMRQQMLAAGPVEGAKLAQYIAENGLSPTMEDRLLKWNAWAGQVAKDQADKNHAQGVEMATNAMLGIEDEVEKEQKRIKKIGKSIGDGVVIGFKSKQSAFKAAVDGYISAAFSALGINSPSKVFIGIGESVGEGFNMGVGDSLDDPFANLSGNAANMRRVYSPSLTNTQAMSADVRVFIGDRELTDIVRTEVDSSNDDLARSLVLGRR